MNLVSMTTRVGVLCSALLMAGASAGENEHRVKVMTVDGEGAEPVVMQFSIDQSLADLEDGESRVITSDNGDTVTVTRAGETLHLSTSNGHEADIPLMGAGQIHVAHSGDKDTEKHVRVIRKHRGEPTDDIMIVAPGGLSDYEKQVLRDAMTSAGIDKELHFVGDGLDGEINIEVKTTD